MKGALLMNMINPGMIAPKAIKHGGWVRCLKCCVASHWNCLAKTQRDEILKATVLREETIGGGDYEKRQTLKWDETTEFVCNSCLRGGICMQCGIPTGTEDPPKVDGIEPAATVTDPNVTAHTPPTAPPEESAQTTNLPSPHPDESTRKPDRNLFRCFTCRRPSHYDHLPAPSDEPMEDDVAEIALYYQDTWRCQDCRRWEYPLDKILAWRPSPADAVEPIRAESEALPWKSPLPREYLVKWQRKSYRHLEWVPHQYLLSTNNAKLRNFLINGKEGGLLTLDHRDVIKSMAGEATSSKPASAPGSSTPPPPIRPSGPTKISDETTETERGKGIQESENLEPPANPSAELCIPRPWTRLDRMLDALFLKPLKKQATAKRNKSELGKKVRQESSTSDEEDDVEDDNEDESAIEDTRRQELIPGEEPDTTITETLAQREAREGELTEKDMKDVVWCFIKWQELTHEDGKMRPDSILVS